MVMRRVCSSAFTRETISWKARQEDDWKTWISASPAAAQDGLKVPGV
jgi:hypothetical protein